MFAYVRDFEYFLHAVERAYVDVLRVPITTNGDRRLFVHVVPQFVWIGEAAKIVCTEAMDTDLPALTAELGLRCPLKIPHATHGTRSATAQNLTTSPEACSAARRIYAHDTMLWRKWCGDVAFATKRTDVRFTFTS